jgi:hypothetical protein
MIIWTKDAQNLHQIGENSTFKKTQEIEAEAPYLSSTLSKDGNWLICGNFKGFIDIFQFNLVSEKFEIFQKIENSHDSFVQTTCHWKDPRTNTDMIYSAGGD